MGSIKVLSLALILCYKVVLDTAHSMSTGMDGLPGYWMVLLCRIFLGKGILGPVGVNCKSSRRSSKWFARILGGA